MSGSSSGENERSATRRAAGALCLVPLLLCAGCATGTPGAVTLTVISPHRDEIREEFALAFQTWFQERTAAQLRAARTELQRILDGGVAVPGSGAAEALETLLADWKEDELREVREAFGHWRGEQNRDNTRALLAALDEWGARPHPVEIVWQDIGGGTSAIVRYVEARYQDHPGGIGIDVLFGGGTDIFLGFAERKRLQKLDLPASLLSRLRPQLNGIPLYDPDHLWFGPMLSGFGILYNRRVLERIGQPEPRRWADLGQPGMRSWVGAGDPRMTGSVHMVYEIILQGMGWDEGFRLLLRLGANTHSFIRDSGTLTRMVSEGEVAAAGNLDANALSAVGWDPKGIGFQLPPGQTIMNPDAVAVLQGAPRPQLARAFVEFTLSDAGQKLILLRPGEAGGPRRYALCRLSVVEQLYEQYPPSARSIGAVNPFAVTDTIRYNGDLGYRRWDALNDLFGAWIADAHPDLAGAWCALLQLPEHERPPLENELFAPPCSASELEAYARQITEKSPQLRTETVTRWGVNARERYRRIRQLAGDRR